MLHQRPCRFLSGGPDVEDQRCAVGNVGCDQARDPALLRLLQHAPRRVADVASAQRRPGPAVIAVELAFPV